MKLLNAFGVIPFHPEKGLQKKPELLLHTCNWCKRNKNVILEIMPDVP